jgi:hypothetical protein
VLVLLMAMGGCVQRRFTVRSNPPGALVYIDNYEVGTTPVSTSFIYYGTRQIRLVKDGYETLTVLQPVPAPWYQWPGIDFFSENVVPGEIRDERILDYQLQPQVLVPTPQLLGRAEELRRGNQFVVPASAPAPTVLPPTTATPGLSPSGNVPPQYFPPPFNGPPPANTLPPPANTLPPVPNNSPAFGAPTPLPPPPTGFDRFNY